jgi:predicted dehydrogenase
MSNEPSTSRSSSPLTRRQFIAGAGATALAFNLVKPESVRGADANSKITLGWMGCGGRGTWIADLFQKHGGYQIVAAHDYFQDKVDAFGDKFGVDKARRYTGLKGYLKMFSQKPDAVVIESPPYFHPEQAAAGVDAGCHVYCAKPIAVDVPGCRTMEASGLRATQKRLAFLIDFQTRASAAYQEAVRRVHAGDIGKLVSGEAVYVCGPTWGAMSEFLKPNPTDPERRLRAWGLDRVLSGDVITEQNIHALDVACWILGANPIKAYGTGGEARGLGGTCWDHFSVIYHFPNDVSLSFTSKQLGHGIDDIMCRVYGTTGTIDTHYFGEVWVKGREDAYNGGRMANLYTEGAVNNIATFHRNIARGDFSNATVPESVRSNLTTILGRTAAYQGKEVTWEQMLKKNEKWEADLKGVKL